MQNLFFRFCVCAAVVPLSLLAADLPSLALPQGVGVNIHFTRGHEKDLDLIAAAGFKFIRMDFSWSGTERKKGEYNWADYEALLANLEQRGMRAVYILDYSNSLYEETLVEKDRETDQDKKVTASPQSPQSVAAFARWAGAAARHFAGRRVIWEIWNEPNIQFWKPKPEVAKYIALAQATCQAVRAADPQATIVAPASSGFPWPFFEAMFKAGLLEQLDAVSVHPYRNYSQSPETALKEYQKLRSLIQRHASAPKKQMPILSGEWGYATHDKGVSLDTQAAFLVRQQLVNVLYGVPLSIWYDWKNDGTNATYNEHNFGTVTPDLQPKPAYQAIQIMTRQLSGFRIARRLAVGDDNHYVLLCVNDAGAQKIAAWSLLEKPTASLNIGLGSEADLAILDGKGLPAPVKLNQGRLTLTLGPLPQYVTMKKNSAVLAAASAWKLDPVNPGAVVAGVKDGLRLPLRVQNPLAQPVTAQATLKGEKIPAGDSKKVKLSPGQSADFILTATAWRRDQESVPVNLMLRLENAAGSTIGESEETLQLPVSNPLFLAVAPVEKGVRVILQNESGSGFNGHLQAGSAKRGITIAPGTTESTTLLSAPADGSVIQLVHESGQAVAQSPASRFQSILTTNCRQRLDGDAQIPAEASLVETAPPAGESPYARVYALTYQFAEGWRFVRCEAPHAKLPQSETPPAGMGIWIYGDKSGNALRLRLRDASGQTFQPSGPNLDWQGWKWVVFDWTNLKSTAHWGGAADGVVKGGLALDTLLLLDGGRRKTSGKIFFAGPVLIY